MSAAVSSITQNNILTKSQSDDSFWESAMEMLQESIPVASPIFQQYLTALGNYAQEAGGKCLSDFQQLESDYNQYCQNPSIGTGAITADIANLETHPPVLSDAEYRAATNKMLDQMLLLATQGADLQPFSLILDTMTWQNPQIPSSFFPIYSSSFSSAYNAYEQNFPGNSPTPQEIATLEEQIELLQEALFS